MSEPVVLEISGPTTLLEIVEDAVILEVGGPTVLLEVTEGGSGGGDVNWDDVLGKPLTFPATAHTHPWSDLSSFAGSSLAQLATRSAADLSSGTLPNARVAAGNVTQHQAALAIAWAQLTGVPATFAPAAHTHPVADLDEWPADAAGVLTNDGAGGLTWEESGGGGPHTHPLADLEGFGAAGGYPRSNGSAWVRVSGVAWGDLTGVPSTFAPSAHTHPLADLTGFGAAGGYARSDGAAWVRVSGIAWGDLTSVPATFAPSAHTHPWADVTGEPTTLGGYGITDAYTEAEVDTLLAGKSDVGHVHTFASLTSKPTTLAGYGITDGALDADLDAHTARTDNPHAVTKAQVGLGSVENTALSTWAGSAAITTLGTIATGVWNATAVAWAKVDKTGSSLADLATKSAGALDSGNLAYARLPTGTGAWDTGAATTITITRSLTVSGTLTGTLTGLAATATALATPRSINGVAFDGTADITVAAAAGTLTGTTLAAAVVTSSLTTIGTLVAGAVPASLVTAGTFGAGSYVFPAALTVTTLLTVGSVAAAGNNVVSISNLATGGTTSLRFYNLDNGDTLTQTAAVWLSPDSRGSAVTGIEAVKENAAYTTTASRDATLVLTAMLNNARAEVMRITSAGHVGIKEAGRVNMDGVLATGDTYAWSPTSDVLALVAGGATTFSITATAATVTGTFKATGNVGFNNATPAAMPDYTVTNGATDRGFDANSNSHDELSDVVATIIADLIAVGIFQ